MILMANAVLSLVAATGLAAATPSSAYTGDQALAQMAASYNASETAILELRAKGWSWSELGDALAVAKRSGKPLSEVVADRDSGMSWSRIAQKRGFSFQAVSSDARHAAKQARKADEQRRQERREESLPSSTAPGAGNAPGVPPGIQQQPPPPH